jgi:hypothetical protein
VNVSSVAFDCATNVYIYCVQVVSGTTVGYDKLITAPIGVLSFDTDALKYIRFALLSHIPDSVFSALKILPPLKSQ